MPGVTALQRHVLDFNLLYKVYRSLTKEKCNFEGIDKCSEIFV